MRNKRQLDAVGRGAEEEEDVRRRLVAKVKEVKELREECAERVAEAQVEIFKSQPTLGTMPKKKMFKMFGMRDAMVHTSCPSPRRAARRAARPGNDPRASGCVAASYEVKLHRRLRI